MRKNFGAKAILYPMPVLIIGTYDEDGKPNAMNAAWGGMADYDKIMVCLSSHKTTENIALHNEFTVSMGVASKVVECDYVGIVSANDELDKFFKLDFMQQRVKK